MKRNQNKWDKLKLRKMTQKLKWTKMRSGKREREREREKARDKFIREVMQPLGWYTFNSIQCKVYTCMINSRDIFDSLLDYTFWYT